MSAQDEPAAKKAREETPTAPAEAEATATRRVTAVFEARAPTRTRVGTRDAQDICGCRALGV